MVSDVAVNDALSIVVCQLQKLSLRWTPRIFHFVVGGGGGPTLCMNIIYALFLQLYYKYYAIGIPET
jgi:hypothetical protein